ncbi:MAG: hypothetical protein ACJ749_00740 [Flavisolibacter sp.]
MKLQLSADTRFRDVKKVFENSFPYLKLEFFRKKHGIQDGNIKNDIVVDRDTIIHVAGAREGEIEVKPWQTVAELEQVFQTKFYLPVHVFRKTKFSWTDTATTDQFTLEKQNRMGREACDKFYDKVELL